MKRLLLLILLLTAPLAAQIDSRTAYRVRTGAAFPATCNRGDVLSLAAGFGYCSATNTWVYLQSPAAGATTFSGAASGTNYTLVTINAATGSATNVYGLRIVPQTVGGTQNWDLWSGTAYASLTAAQKAQADLASNVFATTSETSGLYLTNYATGAESFGLKTHAYATAASSSAVGSDAQAWTAGTSNITSLSGAWAYVEHDSTGTLDEAYGLYVWGTAKGGGAGAITANYGIFVEDQTTAATNYAIKTGAGLVTLGDTLTAPRYATTVNCSDGAGDAACTTASAGSVVIDAADTATVVSTTAVTANSQIFIMEDSSLGTRLSVTCNTTLGRTYAVTARTAATSFTITASAAPVTNPACLSFFIVN